VEPGGSGGPRAANDIHDDAQEQRRFGCAEGNRSGYLDFPAAGERAVVPVMTTHRTCFVIMATLDSCKIHGFCGTGHATTRSDA
jgi:hypothetical protein